MTGTVRKAACELYGSPLTYSGSKDTRETVRGIQVKNASFHNIGCF